MSPPPPPPEPDTCRSISVSLCHSCLSCWGTVTVRTWRGKGVPPGLCRGWGQQNEHQSRPTELSHAPTPLPTLLQDHLTLFSLPAQVSWQAFAPPAVDTALTG